jgi:mannose-6-phosphate isomerase-like protein (cupin superfamily)
MGHQSVQKPTTRAVGGQGKRRWGSWDFLACGEGYVLKRIIVQPGQKLSLQKHPSGPSTGSWSAERPW